MNIRSSPSIKKEIPNIELKNFLNNIKPKAKSSKSFRTTPIKTKKVNAKKLSNQKPPICISSKTPLKQSAFESTSLNSDSLKQLQTFSLSSDEQIISLQKKLKGSELLINKYQAELLKAYERIAELESQLKNVYTVKSYESTQQIFNK